MNTRFFANWTGQARKGFLELAVLNEVRNRRMYGYEIERKFRKSRGPLLSGGTIYSILKRLKRNQLVKTMLTKSPEGPKRKYYQLTPKGRQTLAQMNAYWQAIRKQADSAQKGN